MLLQVDALKVKRAAEARGINCTTDALWSHPEVRTRTHVRMHARTLRRCCSIPFRP